MMDFDIRHLSKNVRCGTKITGRGHMEIIGGMYSGIICSKFISIRVHQVIFGRKTKSLGRDISEDS